MNKVVLVTTLGLIIFTSCKKDWTCTCSADGNSWSETYSNIQKAEAESRCNTYETYSKLANPDASCSVN